MKKIGNKKGVLLNTNYFYWSSTKHNNHACSVNATNGILGYYFKDDNDYVRLFINV